jgi:lactate dehydrogenase-like 2-hydroxyacid dehydrogenase
VRESWTRIQKGENGMKSTHTSKIMWFGPLPKTVITNLLKKRAQPHLIENAGTKESATKEELYESIKDATILLCNPATPRLTRQTLEAAKNLKLVQFMTIGYDDIDLQAATEL